MIEKTVLIADVLAIIPQSEYISNFFEPFEYKTMQADIHPAYEKITVNCSCGDTFETRSTAGKDLTVEVCSKCHPFYTGQQKIVDTAGQVDKFRRRYRKK